MSATIHQHPTLRPGGEQRGFPTLADPFAGLSHARAGAASLTPHLPPRTFETETTIQIG